MKLNLTHVFSFVGCLLMFATPAVARVTLTEKNVTIPTYLAGEPEPNPMFFFGKQSQGAEGRVYPYPLYDSLTHIKTNKSYKIIYLENEYIRVGVMPEIGGRLFEAVDKGNNYDFVYRQHVIKPALIGLIGAWMSGGIEWNIPHHHRATTFLPVQHRVEENSDGSKTVWVGELEVRHRIRWAVGYTLHPGKSHLTAKVRIINRTPLPQTMLCFANVAVHANDNYQIIFPPNTQFVTYHHKREFATWPIATGRYSGADFGNGTDVSWYSNHINANSMFAWNYTDDFFAGYDHGKQVGTMSVAYHHVVPGKKFWTWGSGPRGRMWDKILTDEDGPYIELMTGAYSDNQPDYSWLQPFETKSFEMHWYPFRDIGGVKNANLDAAVNLEIGTNGATKVGFYTTAEHRSARAILKAGEEVLFDEKISINPNKTFTKQLNLLPGTDPHSVRASLNVLGEELIGYSPVRLTNMPMPEVVKNPLAPKDIKSVEELYLTGQRIEQFHDPDREPDAYWEEALKRDAGDARVNTVVGIKKLKQARFAEAEQHFRKATERLTGNYTTARDGEPFYYLGFALKAQGKFDEAADAFQKAAWSEAWRSPAYFTLAEIASRHGEFEKALDVLERSLQANALNVRALTLKSAMLRLTGKNRAALEASAAAWKIDPLDVRVVIERGLAGDGNADREWRSTLTEYPIPALEVATEYGNAGLWNDGEQVLSEYIRDAEVKAGLWKPGERVVLSSANPTTLARPLAYYYTGHFLERQGKTDKAARHRRMVLMASERLEFPFQWEAIHVLRRAMEANPKDARAPYYLGNLLFDWQPDEAVKLWEKSAEIDPSFAIVHRNIAIAAAHRKPTNDIAKAISHLEEAVELPIKYAMHFTELDELYAEAGKSPAQRLALMERNQDVVLKRDDSLSRAIGLKVFAGKYDEAIALMSGRKFSVWEGGTLDVADHWVNAHLLRGQKKVAARDFTGALADFKTAEIIPDNLPSDRNAGRGREAEIAYLAGLAHEGAGDSVRAKEAFQRAAGGSTEARRRRGPARGVTERSAQRYYQALAQRKLGQNTEANAALKSLLEAAQRALEPGAATDEGNESNEERMSVRLNEALARYVAGVAHAGLGDKEKAKQELTGALELRPDHLGAKVALSGL
jgi:tetratricopeptide (TPR) repeat protein